MITSEIVEAIWDQLSRRYPSVVGPDNLWDWYYENYNEPGTSVLEKHYGIAGPDWWDVAANELLLILASEGEQIHWEEIDEHTN